MGSLGVEFVLVEHGGGTWGAVIVSCRVSEGGIQVIIPMS